MAPIPLAVAAGGPAGAVPPPPSSIVLRTAAGQTRQTKILHGMACCETPHVIGPKPTKILSEEPHFHTGSERAPGSGAGGGRGLRQARANTLRWSEHKRTQANASEHKLVGQANTLLGSPLTQLCFRPNTSESALLRGRTPRPAPAPEPGGPSEPL